MKIDYSSVLNADRIRPDHAASGAILAELEHDRTRLLFSAAFRRLQQCGSADVSANPHTAARSKFSDAMQTAQVGRLIAGQIVARLEAEQLASPTACAAILGLVETGCLLRHIGTPPFGQAGAAAVQAWFADHGSEKLRAACKTYEGRAIDAADPRLLNALADFSEFGSNPQGLRVIAKLPTHTDPRGLNLTKTSIVTYLKYLRMAGTRPDDPSERFTEKAGFFSTEVGLVKSVWSEFSVNAAEPQRFPLTYIVEAADRIVTTLNDLEDAIDAGNAQQAFGAIMNAWIDTPIAEPSPCDDAIRTCLWAAAETPTGSESGSFGSSFGELRATLVELFVNHAAARYMSMHQEVFDGTQGALLPNTSGPGAAIAIFKAYAAKHRQGRQDLTGYAIVYGLLTHFSPLVACSAQRLRAALEQAEQDEKGKPIFIESKLLSLIPAEYVQIYTHVVAQIGNAGGRDAEFEEWNARAHLLVDFISGMTEPHAAATFASLSGK
jgi:dGTPase